MKTNSHFFIVISGPTAVGKTDLVNELSRTLSFPVEIVNSDMGQMYTPLTIGTAKPHSLNEPVKHHLFNILNEPVDYTVTEFRKNLLTTMHELWSRGVVPLVVGGSSFYVQSLFFPPRDVPMCHTIARETACEVGDTTCEARDTAHEADTADETQEDLPASYKKMGSQDLWNELNTIDPERAARIHPHDRYRVERAVALWLSTGTLPSACAPLFDPPGACAFYYITRERQELNNRINVRTQRMIDAGWVEEVRGLSTAWHAFLKIKKLIGYPEIISFIESQSTDTQSLIEEIRKKTRWYAKRQMTFWRMLKNKLRKHDPEAKHLKIIHEVNLTLLPLDLYIKQLTDELNALYKDLENK